MSAAQGTINPRGTRAVPIDMDQLQRVGARPRFLDYLVQLWDFREFIFYDARARVQSGTRRDKLGSAWLILNPLFSGMTYYVIFGLLLGTGKGIPNFLGYLVIGIFMYQITAGAITSGARSIQQNRSNWRQSTRAAVQRTASAGHAFDCAGNSSHRNYHGLVVTTYSGARLAILF